MDRKITRDSNMELLRIVSMLLIMVLHADFASLSIPTIIECDNSPVISFLRFLVESLSVVAVNVFVLLSGWYGIKPSRKKFCEFLFQAVFLILAIYLVFSLFRGIPYHDFGDWLKIIFLQQYWFVQSYIILYLFSPVLNTFVQNTNKHSFSLVLLSLFLVQFAFGYLPFSSNFGWYQIGYSPLTFFFLYLLARYIRFYIKLIHSFIFYFSIWLFCSCISAIIGYITTLLGYGSSSVLYVYGYTSPFSIIGAIMFLIAFSRLSINSRFVNWVAKSSFAVYIVHCHECIFVPIYCYTIGIWFVSEVYCVFVIKTGVLITSIYIIAIFIDKIRIVLWDIINNGCLRYFFSKSLNV